MRASGVAPDEQNRRNDDDDRGVAHIKREAGPGSEIIGAMEEPENVPSDAAWEVLGDRVVPAGGKDVQEWWDHGEDRNEDRDSAAVLRVIAPRPSANTPVTVR